MQTTDISDGAVPYFAWDRTWTAGEIRRRLRETTGAERDRIVAWILREAAFQDVWSFLDPREVGELLPRLEHRLGRKKAFWQHIIRSWHELGKL